MVNLKNDIIYYLIYTAFLFVGFYIGDKNLALSEFEPIMMFAFWFVVIFITDKFIMPKVRRKI